MLDETGKLPWKRKDNHVESKNPNCQGCKNPHPNESLSITNNKYCDSCYREILTRIFLGK